MPRFCPNCRYDIGAVLDSGLGRCPECGRPLSRSTILPFLPRPWWWYALAAPWALLPGALMLAPIFLSRAPDGAMRTLAPFVGFLGLGAGIPFLVRWSRWAIAAHGIEGDRSRPLYFGFGLFLYNLLLAGLGWVLAMP